MTNNEALHCCVKYVSRSKVRAGESNISRIRPSRQWWCGKSQEPILEQCAKTRLRKAAQALTIVCRLSSFDSPLCLFRSLACVSEGYQPVFLTRVGSQPSIDTHWGQPSVSLPIRARVGPAQSILLYCTCLIVALF